MHPLEEREGTLSVRRKCGCALPQSMEGCDQRSWNWNKVYRILNQGDWGDQGKCCGWASSLCCSLKVGQGCQAFGHFFSQLLTRPSTRCSWCWGCSSENYISQTPLQAGFCSILSVGAYRGVWHAGEGWRETSSFPLSWLAVCVSNITWTEVSQE